MKKYCPFCGAELIVGASFCMECGKGLPQSKNTHELIKKQSLNPPSSALPTSDQKPPAEQSINDGYDHYYDDVLPIDSGENREHMRSTLIKRIALLCAGTVGIIVLAVVIMKLL